MAFSTPQSSDKRSHPVRTLILLAFAVVADRWLKQLALHGVTSHTGPVTFVLFRNDGLVFSLPVQQLVGVIVMMAAAFVVVALAIRWWQQRHRLNLGLSLMIIGAASNLYDRLRFGFVIDWAYLGTRWPVFNLADVFVAVGLIFYLRQRIR